MSHCNTVVLTNTILISFISEPGERVIRQQRVPTSATLAREGADPLGAGGGEVEGEGAAQAEVQAGPSPCLDTYEWRELSKLKDITGVWKQFEEEIKPLLPSGTYELVWPATFDDTFNLLQAQYEVRVYL